MTWGDQVSVMLQSYDMFRSGNAKTLPDTSQNSIASFTLLAESLAKVNEMMENGLKAGGNEPTPMVDEGFMQLRNLEDPDGHIWGSYIPRP
ncbi:MAG: hypothetical protein U0V75_16290 [Ferruginibacter sp.]